MKEIYYCRKIWKEAQFDIKRGDIGFIEEHDLPDIVSRSRLFLSDVINWEEYKCGSNMPYFFSNKEEKVRIYGKQGPTTIILLSIEEFDKVMEQYYNSLVKFKQN